jgi:hypothetical protein
MGKLFRRKTYKSWAPRFRLPQWKSYAQSAGSFFNLADDYGRQPRDRVLLIEQASAAKGTDGRRHRDF